MTPTKRTIKVRIPITVEVDVDTWAEAFGTEATAADVRADVRDYFLNVIAQSPAVADADLIVRAP